MPSLDVPGVHQHIGVTLTISSILGVVVAGASCLDFCNREVK